MQGRPSGTHTGYDVLAYVFCYGANGLPINSEFTASYHRERTVRRLVRAAEVLRLRVVGRRRSDQLQLPVRRVRLQLHRGASPRPAAYIVRYPNLTLNQNHSQATAYGSGNTYCNLTQPWFSVGPDVRST